MNYASNPGLILAAFLCLWIHAASAADRYTLTEIDVPYAGRENNFSDMNLRGQVAGGSAFHASATQAKGKNAVDLLPDSFVSWANAINDAGQVVGYINEDNARWRAFVMNADGSGLKMLRTLGGYVTIAKAINNNGQIAGNAKLPD